MTKKKPNPLTMHISAEQRENYTKAAIAAGFESGKGPGIGPWLRSLGDAACLPDEAGSEVVTFEGMTSAEQWWFVDEVWAENEGPLGEKAYDIQDEMNGSGLAKGWEKVDEKYRGEAPGYQARYDAALAHVKGVMDAG